MATQDKSQQFRVFSYEICLASLQMLVLLESGPFSGVNA